jgi:hypothetical protein
MPWESLGRLRNSRRLCEGLGASWNALGRLVFGPGRKTEVLGVPNKSPGGDLSMGKLHPKLWEALGTLLEASGRPWETWGSYERFWEVLGVPGRALGSLGSFWQGLGDSWVDLGSSWRPLESSGKESWDDFENPQTEHPR